MRITRANTKAINYACKNFHYSHCVPATQYAYNVYNNNDEWCGVILYGGGANHHMPHSFGKNAGEVLELVRVALNGKQEMTSQAVALSLKVLKKENPLCKMIVSYADLDQNHNGTIYQATNWIYLGKVNENSRSAFIINGKKTHPRSVASKGVKQNIDSVRKKLDPNATVWYTKGKHKYLYVFDKKERKKWEQKAVPYPKK